MPVRIAGMIRFHFWLLAIALLLPTPAMAWGNTGHRLVARLAETQLTNQARAQLRDLLAGESDASLAGIANWADELRGSDPDLGKRSASWHYVNLGEHGCHYELQRDCPGGNCVVEALQRQTAILADARQPRAERLQALKFVVHLVGDAHQPLHAGYAHDRGGNTFQVNLNGKGSNLHSLWDSGLLATSGLDEDALLRRLRSLQGKARVAQRAPPGKVVHWVERACRIAMQPGFYPASAKIGDAYARAWLPVAEQRLLDAGTQLAAVLNASLAH